MERKESPLVVIVGPTASGKSALAMDIAERYDGEVICADSRTVYRDMDIGTAKPSREEQARIPHWGLDLIDPGQRYTAADFKTYATQKIAEIRSRGHLPILVGGTGLYVDGVIFDYQFGPDRNEAERSSLMELSTEQLQKYCSENNIELPTNTQNRRHLIRAIEQKSINNKRRTTPILNTVVVGITTDKSELAKRIRQRIEQMLSDGVVNEAIMLGKKYGWKSESMTSNIYRYIVDSTDKGSQYPTSLDVDKMTTNDVKLAKKQMTWFRRNPHIKWGNIEQLRNYLDDVISN